MSIVAHVFACWGIWLLGFLCAGFLLARKDWDNQWIEFRKPSSFFTVIGYGVNGGEPVRGRVYNKWFVEWLYNKKQQHINVLKNKAREVRELGG